MLVRTPFKETVTDFRGELYSNKFDLILLAWISYTFIMNTLCLLLFSVSVSFFLILKRISPTSLLTWSCLGVMKRIDTLTLLLAVFALPSALCRNVCTVWYYPDQFINWLYVISAHEMCILQCAIKSWKWWWKIKMMSDRFLPDATNMNQALLVKKIC